MVERIEIGVRTQLIYNLSNTYGAWWFEDRSKFHDEGYWRSYLDFLKKELRRSREVFYCRTQSEI
jgi:abortive infection bacteriophage resistance protein